MTSVFAGKAKPITRVVKASTVAPSIVEKCIVVAVDLVVMKRM